MQLVPSEMRGRIYWFTFYITLFCTVLTHRLQQFQQQHMTCVFTSVLGLSARVYGVCVSRYVSEIMYAEFHVMLNGEVYLVKLICVASPGGLSPSCLRG